MRSFAGASVGRWFGVHDDRLVDWPRTGTLTHGNDPAAAGYVAIPQTDLAAVAPPTAVPMHGGVPSRNGRAATVDEGGVPLRNGRASTVDEGDLESISDAGRQPNRGRRRIARAVSSLFGFQGQRRNETPEEIQRSLPTFWPVVTILVAVTEVALLIAVMASFGLAPIAFRPRSVTEVISGFNNQSTTVTKQIVPNFFIGPSSEALVHTGAMYAPVGCSIL